MGRGDARQSSYNTLASPTARGATARSSAQRGVLTDICFAIIWQAVLPHGGKGQQFSLNLLDLGCLMGKDGPTAKVANILIGTRSSSLASFPHCLGHANNEAETCFCLGQTTFFAGKFPFSSIVLRFTHQ